MLVEPSSRRSGAAVGRSGLPRDRVLAMSVSADRPSRVHVAGPEWTQIGHRHRKKVDAGGLGRSLNLLFSGRFIGKRQLAEIGLERFHTAEVTGSSPAAPTNRPRERGTAARRGTKDRGQQRPATPGPGAEQGGSERTSRAAEGGGAEAGRAAGRRPAEGRTHGTHRLNQPRGIPGDSFP